MSGAWGNIAGGLLESLGQATQGYGTFFSNKQAEVAAEKRAYQNRAEEQARDHQNKLELQKNDPMLKVLQAQYPDLFKNLGNAQPDQQEYGYEQDYSYGGQEEEPDAQNQAMLEKMNKAYQWATENPDDPRSKGILKKLGL